MDPQAALYGLLMALSVEDRETALTMMNALGGWLQYGGFFPSVEKIVEPEELTPQDLGGVWRIRPSKD